MKVHEFLADPSRWTRQAFARDKDGVPVLIEDEDAVCFCLRGAICRCYPSDVERVIQKLYTALPPKMSTISWNDHPARTHEEVLALVKELDV